MGWIKAADPIVAGLSGTSGKMVVTHGFARLMMGAKEVKRSRLGDAVNKMYSDATGNGGGGHLAPMRPWFSIHMRFSNV